MQEPKIMNGVNVTELFNTIDAIEENSEIAKFNFRGSNAWLDGGKNRTTISDFHGACEDQPHARAFIFKADEPPVLLGEDTGANPVEYALTALAACVTTAMVYHAAARGIHLEEVESRIEGDLDLRGFLGMDENIRNGYEGVNMKIRVKADVPEEQLEEVMNLGPTYSPVFDIFTNRVPVSVSLDRSESSARKRAA
jgi:uncharacterized OsmC-like protein